MKLRQLAYFRAVVAHGSLAAAADILHVAQPNLSVAIKQLEAEWGVALFDRIGRGLTLTETGRLLFDRAQQLLGNAEAIEDEMRAIGRGSTGRIRVGYTTLYRNLVIQMVDAVRKQGDATSFSLRQAEPEALELMVEQRQLDFALTQLPVVNPALQILTLPVPRLMLIARSDDPQWAKSAPLPLAHLSGIPLILLKRSSGSGFFEQVNDAFQRAGFLPTMVADCTEISVMLELVRAGVGVGLTPVLGDEQPPAGLYFRPVTGMADLQPMSMIMPRGRRFVPGVQKAMEFCQTQLTQN
ncbi:LysR family transcriptional regulator [Sphingobium sp.]|uniref:LysR family transcriptional regulator n=1 Tax=Sphingobium sp. TaxID=1912891 RepID=UPI002605728A|nr:LysR family transcriptional regulator [Sphingobium sp.]